MPFSNATGTVNTKYSFTEAISMVWVAKVADARGDRKFFLALAALIGAVALYLSMSFKDTTVFAIHYYILGHVH